MRSLVDKLLRHPLTIAVAVVLAGAVFFKSCNESAWEKRAKAALALADSLSAEVSQHEARADSLLQVVARIQPRLAEREETIRVMLRDVRAQPVPEPCREYTEPRDDLVDTLLVQVDDLRSALNAQIAASAELRAALDLSKERGDSLQSVLDDRPTQPWYVPTIGAGPFAGVCTDGRACAGFGISLQWRLPNVTNAFR